MLSTSTTISVITSQVRQHSEKFFEAIGALVPLECNVRVQWLARHSLKLTESKKSSQSKTSKWHCHLPSTSFAVAVECTLHVATSPLHMLEH
jgi:hypothetical protein